MSSGFPNLPRKVLAILFSYLDVKYIFELREVCKATNKIVDNNYLVNYIYLFMIRQADDGDVVITLLTWDTIHDSLWAFAVNRARSLLGSVDFIKNEPERKGRCITAKMAAPELVKFLNYMNFILRRACYSRIYFGYADTDFIAECLKFIDGKAVSMLTVETNKIPIKEFFPFLELIRKLKLHNVLTLVKPTFDRDAIDFVLQLSAFVRSIKVSTWKSVDRHFEMLPIMKEIFSRKCESLEINEMSEDGMPASSISKEDVENLIQYLNHINKKVRLSARTDAQPTMNGQIGGYKITVGNLRRSNMVINHMDNIL